MNNVRDRSIIKCYRGGSHLRDVAAQHDVSHETVRKVLKRHGVELRGRGRPRTEVVRNKVA